LYENSITKSIVAIKWIDFILIYGSNIGIKGSNLSVIQKNAYFVHELPTT